MSVSICCVGHTLPVCRMTSLCASGMICTACAWELSHEPQSLFMPSPEAYCLRSMNTVSNPPLPARPLALPNLLTYARIAAVPVVVGLLYWQSILDGGLWIRWVALAVFIAAGITDV